MAEGSRPAAPRADAGLDPAWWQAALDPPRAHGEAVVSGRLRVAPEDFLVTEELGFAPSGDGPHVLLEVRKRDANTEWVARQLARAGGCRAGEVGYAGLKDRRAVAVQWFSVPRGSRPLEAWADTRGEGFEVLTAQAHSRKLPRGALAGNRFRIRVRAAQYRPEALAARLTAIADRGVPNYFGPQRFGRSGANLARIGAGLPALQPRERGYVLSAARSLIFNAVSAARVNESSWARIEGGDIANLDGRGTIFAVEVADEALEARCRRLEIHPTGPLWGQGEPSVAGRIQRLERAVAAQFPAAAALVEAAGLRQERRSLRLTVRDLAHELAGPDLIVGFRLGRGSFATAVLREIGQFDAPSQAEEHD